MISAKHVACRFTAEKNSIGCVNFGLIVDNQEGYFIKLIISTFKMEEDCALHERTYLCSTIHTMTVSCRTVSSRTVSCTHVIRYGFKRFQVIWPFLL